MYTSVTKGATLIVLLLAGFPSFAQNNVLDQYIQQAFQNNKGLREQHFELEKSMYALQEARSLFGPNVALLGNYTKAKGGRTIDFPAGDMLNPVYKSLNHLTGSNQFPPLENVSVQLAPDNFYDVKLRTSLPLVNAEIYYNQQIKKEQITQQQAALNVYKRELVKDIKTAYFQYYQASQAVSIYNSALSLINENIRINESMIRNGIRNNTALYRSQTEKEKTDGDINKAINARENAKAYFNFLLNRQLTDSVTLDITLLQTPTLAASSDINAREELTQLQSAAKSYRLNEQLQRSYLIPKLNTFLDLGTQSMGLHFDNQSRYYMFGVNLEWNLFAANKNRYKIKQAQVAVQSISNQADKTADALRLQLYEASNNYRTAVLNFRTAQSQLSFAERYYRDQLKVYKAGQLLYIELLDAQNQLTQARLQTVAAQAAVQTAFAAVERTEASYQINSSSSL
ncbi:TolC family protein [Chitinophaga nivalis]|uniref:TolC family protein n=1 Tax=Chitinophaga nivalis TaxID=2991709 RepID=A0ABT3IHF2_9BACT|nr:TolC family protein [Chitinophaga nivalis]MCW3466914.1 TolC family protein [Chitinophaga nivalis]MCW3483395.1 TolC family protein [Chitinophaga nivalis]